MRRHAWIALVVVAGACNPWSDERAQLERERHELREERRRFEEEKVEHEKRTGLKIDLPAGAAEEIDTTRESIIVVLPAGGEYAVGGKLLTGAELDALFRRAYADDPRHQVVIQSERGVDHGRVVDVMERAKAAGLTRLAIGTSSR